jgi:hypothetical protein
MTESLDLRCSAWSRVNHVDPIGTAGSYSGFLLIDWPLPWPRDISEIEPLTQVAAACRDAHVRLQALVPSGDGESRVTFYSWDESIGRFTGVGARVGARPAETAIRLLNGAEGENEIQGTDVLICGHGRRDRCCGSAGTSLAIEAAASANRDAAVRIRRTSHTGGHRFAPTAMVFPEGTCWGYLDGPALDSILARSGHFRDHAFRYRGCTGLAGREVQALERRVLEDVGWTLFDRPRSGQQHDNGIARLTTTDLSGGKKTWQGKVIDVRTLRIPNCGQPVTEADKVETELQLTEFVEGNPEIGKTDQ